MMPLTGSSRRLAAAALVLAAGLLPVTLAAPARAEVREGLHLKSAILGRDVKYAVYLPPDYAASTRRYPVVYLLHGYTDDEVLAMKLDAWDKVIGPVFGPGLSGKDRLTPHFRQYSPLELARTLPEESLKKVRLYLDCGNKDFLIRGNCALHLLLSDRKIPHEFRVRDGSHTWSYWRSGIVDGLAFIGESFRR